LAPVVPHNAAPATCEGATMTAAANHTLHANGSIDGLAVASSARHTVILASVGGAMHSASLDATQLDGGPILRDFLDTARARKER